MQNFDAFHKIKGIKGKCGWKEVFLGFAPANILFAHSFSDIFDEETGLGYQRQRDRAHSINFKKYIMNETSTTIPLTFNLREELEQGWEIVEEGESIFLYIKKGFKCLAQVDCQHRIGELGDSDIPLAFMAFIGMDIKNEIGVFTIINSKAKGLSNSLTDYNHSVLFQNLEQDAPHLFIARKLNEDINSPWYQQVKYGGKCTSGLNRRTSLRMMQSSIKKLLSQIPSSRNVDLEDTYQIIVKYWDIISRVFHEDWENTRSSLITKGVGLYAFNYLLGSLFENDKYACIDEQTLSTVINKLVGKVDWSNNGPFSSLGGQKAAKRVFAILQEIVKN
jgi:DNA sulfur modification protein DndB